MRRLLHKLLAAWFILSSIAALFPSPLCFALNENNYESIIAKAESIKKSDADESLQLAQAVAHQSRSPQLRARALNLAGVILKRKKQYSDALKDLNESYRISKEVGEIKMAIESLNNIADTQRQSKNTTEAIKSIKTAIKLASANTDNSQLVTLYRTQGKIYKATKQYEKSLTSFLQAEKFVNADTPHKTASDVYNKIAQAYARLEHADKAAKYKVKVLENEIKDPSTKPITLVKNLDDLSTYNRKLGDYRKALQYAIRAQKTLDSLNDPKALQHVYLNLTIIFRRLGEYDLALGYAKKMRQSYLTDNNLKGVSTSNIQIALIYDNLKQYEEANDFYHKTLNIPKEKTTQKNRASANRGIASIYHKQGNYKEALYFAEQAKSSYTKINSLSGIEASMRLIGLINTSIGNTPQALHAFNQALALSKKLNAKWEEASNLINIGVALSDSQPNTAVKNIEHGIKIAAKASAKQLILRGYHALATINEKSGSYEKAYKYSDLLRQLSDEINHDLITKRISDLEIVSESDNKKRKIERLQREAKTNNLEISAKTSQLENLGLMNLSLKSKISREQNTLTLTLLCTAIFIIFSFLLYTRIRRYNKLNKTRFLSNASLEMHNTNITKNITTNSLNNNQAATIFNYLQEVLTEILSLSKTLQKQENIDADISNSVTEKLFNSAQEVSNIIEYHADYFRPLHNSDELNLSQHSIYELYADISDTLENSAKDKSISLEANIDSNSYVYTDKNIARAILFHLITNIIRITKNGRTLSLHTKNGSTSIQADILASGLEAASGDISTLFNAEETIYTNVKLAEVEGGFDLCTALVKLVGGEIGMRNVETNTCEFYLTLGHID